MAHTKFRLVTRRDFDGLVCAVLLNELDLIDDIKFVHPKDMQDGKTAVPDRDITTNLPFALGVDLAVDNYGGGQGRFGPIQPRRDHVAHGLGAVEFFDGFAYGLGSLPRIPRQ